jgi:hypothetical protein
MRIQIDPHTLVRAIERGASENEINDVLVSGFDIPVKRNRRGKAKVYQFNQKRLNTFYEQKRIEVIYTIEGDRIVTVTVYVFYGNWEETK